MKILFSLSADKSVSGFEDESSEEVSLQPLFLSERILQYPVTKEPLQAKHKEKWCFYHLIQKKNLQQLRRCDRALWWYSC